MAISTSTSTLRLINIGGQSNDGQGDTIREAFDKVNKNFIEVYGYVNSGTGVLFTNLDDVPQTLIPDAILIGAPDGSNTVTQKTLVSGVGIQIESNTSSYVLSGQTVLYTDPNPILSANLNGNFLSGFNFASPNADTPYDPAHQQDLITVEYLNNRIGVVSLPDPNKIVQRDEHGIMWGTASAAWYADLAEKYVPDQHYDEGTVVIFGGTAEITISTFEMDRRVAGVISTKPAYLMNTGSDGLPVALQGRVPCKVTGTVRKGDMLVTSNIPGVAVASDEPRLGAVIGKALGSHTGDEIGVIEVVVGRV